MRTIESMGYTVFSDELEKIPIRNGSLKVLSTISPNSYGIATKDSVFKAALLDADYLVLDGVYFALSSILLSGTNIRRNQGPDVFYHFMNRLNITGGRIFFLGSSYETLQKIKTKAGNEYPHIEIDYYSPPYKPEFTPEDNDVMIEKVNAFAPDILFVGMTCPKQEKWIAENRTRLNASLTCAIGAVFDWYAGNYKTIHPVWWKLRLGWLVRAMQRPELIRRNVPNYYIFAKDLFRKFLHKIFVHKKPSR